MGRPVSRGEKEIKQVANVLLENDTEFAERFQRDSKNIYKLLIKSLKKIVEGKALDTVVDRKNGTVVNVPVSSAVVVAAARVLKELVIDKMISDKKETRTTVKGPMVTDLKKALEEIEGQKRREGKIVQLRAVGEKGI